MRILLVDVNYEYKNPMYRQFYTSLFYYMEVEFFGPGYVSRECLEKGILQYLSERGKFNAILLGNYFVYSSKGGLRYSVYRTHRNTIPYYNVNDASQCCGKILEDLKKIDNIVKIFLYYDDSVSLPLGDRNECLELIENNFYILSWPLEYMEEYNDKLKEKYPYLTNYAYELAKKYSKYYIPIPFHGISYNEIFVRNFSDRIYTWCIPGNKAEAYYPERHKAQMIIEKNQKKVWHDDPYQALSVASIDRKHMEWYEFRNKAGKFLSWLWGKDDHIPSYPKMQYIAACRELYFESMRSSKYVYAEGGVGNCFVRKYYEACASGAVLVAKRVPGMNEMGFVHEKNCIIVDKYDDIVNIKYTEYQLEKIAKAGQELIINKHMFINRAKVLMQTVETIIYDKYKGAFWQDGNYVLEK